VVALRQRLKTAGIKGFVSSNNDQIVVQVPGARPSTSLVKSTAQLYFYDWEPNVIGPDGQPQPTEEDVTGGRESGASTFGLTEYQAVLRAAKRRAELRENDSTWQPGCTASQLKGCLYGSWYRIDLQHKDMVCPKHASQCPPAPTSSSLLQGTRSVPAARTKIVRVEPGTILLQARPAESSSGRVTDTSPDSYYVIKDNPILSGADITHPQQGFDEGNGVNGQPNVNFGFTSHGRAAFEQVTKEIARRGQEAQLPGVTREAALQHFAVALDGQLITTPSIDFTRYPEGIDASQGSEISGGFDLPSAKELTEEVAAGSLPVRLVLRREDLATTFR
jgi:SecD/SecF fusion protein